MAKKKTPAGGRMGKAKAREFWKWLGLVVGTLLLIGATTMAILCVYGVHYVQSVILPEVENSSTNLVTSNTALSSVLYYQDPDSGKYQTLQTLYASENRVWVSYQDIPQDLVNATVAIEDKRFWDHHGVDWKRTAAAILYMMTGQRVQGGSTITQQLIKNLSNQDQVTVRRKVLEIFEALEFEKNNTKETIMEWYLNEIYLGHGCYGVVTAAEKYFGKDLDELTLAQCASLISITNNPSLYDPYTKPENNLKRRNLVLDEMYEQGKISEEERDAAKAEALNCTYGSTQTEDGIVSTGEQYNWYTDAVISQIIDDLQEQYDYSEKEATQLIYSGGLQVYTCFDPNVQENVDVVYQDMSNVEGFDSSDGQQLQSGITVVDNETGAVVALAGGIGEKVGNRVWSYATDTIRQSGSSLKPLAAYAQALEAGLILPNTIVEDSAFTTRNGRGWPKNSHGGYTGNVDVQTAVAQSINTVAVKVLDMVGLQNSYDFLTQKFGLTTIVDDYTTTSGKNFTDIGYAQLGLGGLTKGVSTYAMAGAYATFPRGGSYVEPYLYTVVLDSDNKIILSSDAERAENTAYSVVMSGDEVVDIEGTPSNGTAILSESTCFYMNQMMEEVVNNGTGTMAKISGMHVAGKTGTTDDDYDRWFVGYTPYYTAAVWTGYDIARPINCGYNPALELWQKVMAGVSAGQADREFDEELASTAKRVTYCTKTGKVATSSCSKAGTTSSALFLPGDEPTGFCTSHSQSQKTETDKKDDTSSNQTDQENTSDNKVETDTKPQEEQEETTTPEEEPPVETPESEPSEPETPEPSEPETPEASEPETPEPEPPRQETTPPETPTEEPSEEAQPSEENLAVTESENAA